MRIRIPPRKIRERFLLVSELEGCQKAVDLLTKYYRVRRMKIVLDGRRVGNGEAAVYFENKATSKEVDQRNGLYFTNYTIMWSKLRVWRFLIGLRKGMLTFMREIF